MDLLVTREVSLTFQMRKSEDIVLEALSGGPPLWRCMQLCVWTSTYYNCLPHPHVQGVEWYSKQARERERERERELSLSHGVIIMPSFLLFYMESGLMITVTVFIWEFRRWGGIDKRKIWTWLYHTATKKLIFVKKHNYYIGSRHFQHNHSME